LSRILTQSLYSLQIVNSTFDSISAIHVIKSESSNLYLDGCSFSTNKLTATCISSLLVSDRKQCLVPGRNFGSSFTESRPPSTADESPTLDEHGDREIYEFQVVNSNFTDCGGAKIESICVGYNFDVFIDHSRFSHEHKRQRMSSKVSMRPTTTAC
jgi:hypothetical protein